MACVIYDAQLLKKFGGFVEGQYYFNNQWFFNAVYAVSKAYGVSRSRYLQGAGVRFASNGMEWAMGDNAQTIQQARSDPVVPSHPGHQVRLAVLVCRGHYFQYLTPLAAAPPPDSSG